MQGERWERGQWGRVALQGVEMSDNWEEGAGMVVLVLLLGLPVGRGGGGMVSGVGVGDSRVAFVKGVWTCWRGGGRRGRVRGMVVVVVVRRRIL